MGKAALGTQCIAPPPPPNASQRLSTKRHTALTPPSLPRPVVQVWVVSMEVARCLLCNAPDALHHNFLTYT